jgi:hypothetical protein
MILRTGAATLGLSLAGLPALRAAADTSKTKKVLFFSKSSGFEHSAIKIGKDGSPGLAQKTLAELGPKNGIEFTFSKDGSLFNPDYLAQFDAYFFYTTGVLTEAGNDKNPPMTPEGKAAFLDAIKNGKGFIGTHSASDTFHYGEGNGVPEGKAPTRYKNYGDLADPYIRMLGGEFIHHDKQQVAKIIVEDPKFPGFDHLGDSFSWNEEWYSLKDFSSDLHVILLQETAGMVGSDYQRPSYPETWARMHGKGRVFYTSLGHRDDVWTNPLYHELLFGGIAWAVRNVDADITPNIDKVAPHCMELPAPPAPKKAN